jgi:hypothetical protein
MATIQKKSQGLGESGCDIDSKKLRNQHEKMQNILQQLLIFRILPVFLKKNEPGEI